MHAGGEPQTPRSYLAGIIQDQHSTVGLGQPPRSSCVGEEGLRVKQQREALFVSNGNEPHWGSTLTQGPSAASRYLTRRLGTYNTFTPAANFVYGEDGRRSSIVTKPTVKEAKERRESEREPKKTAKSAELAKSFKEVETDEELEPAHSSTSGYKPHFFDGRLAPDKPISG
ncbi:uncharacterized protein FRV6_07194 [Fusarium oxysporum]|uniref:Uncharacterized protein n=1 Tax=Fusarium oxysporum TaxID=5507 RepID=A0A2H3T3I3_FUSOX|nr:uncharacterized protein FRV6_07194 [Fusarium oxysporum]